MKDTEARRNARRDAHQGCLRESSAWRDIRELEREAEALGEWMDDLGDRR